MKTLSLVTLTLLMVGCSLAPHYSPPDTCAPDSWKTQPPAEAEVQLPPCGPWWTIFNDPCLDALEELAIAQNPTLEIAYQNIIQAEASAAQSRAAFFPSVSLSTYGVNLMSLYDPGEFGAPAIPPFRAHIQQYAIPASALYEVDLFGKIRNNYNAALYTAEAKAYLYERVKLTLTTNVASTYFRLRSLDAQNNVLKNTVASRQEDVNILSVRYEAGLINASDITRAKAQMAMDQAELAEGLLERANDENLLATLLGFYASDYSFAECPLYTLPPNVAPFMPGSLLERRPDVHEAERNMAAQNAMIGVARAEYFPSLALTGSLGFASPSISNLLDWQARLWMWAFAATQTLFDGGKISADVELAKSQFLQAVANYTQTTLNAFKEAESALAATRYTKEKFDHYQAAVEAAEDTKSISQERYLKGLFTYLEVEDANRTLLTSQLSLERARFERYQATIQLVKSLGGDFPCR